jgi:hypothetical protein
MLKEKNISKNKILSWCVALRQNWKEIKKLHKGGVHNSNSSAIIVEAIK